MIFGGINNFTKYFGGNLVHQQKHMASLNTEIPVGRIDFSNDMYANVADAQTKLVHECKPEAHRKYCDICNPLTNVCLIL